MANLMQLRRARIVANLRGVKIRSVGSGNQHTLHFRAPSGAKVRVWYPEDGRVRDLDERDLDEVIEAMESGEFR